MVTHDHDCEVVRLAAKPAQRVVSIDALELDVVAASEQLDGLLLEALVLLLDQRDPATRDLAHALELGERERQRVAVDRVLDEHGRART